MKRWVGGGVAVAVALAAALGIGWVRSDRQLPMVPEWWGTGQVAAAAGSEFELLALRAVDYEPLGSSEPVPMGAVVVQVDIRQHVLEVPDEDYLNSCSLTLVNGPDSWFPSSDVRYDLELSPNCDRTTDGPVEPGQERVVSAAWVVPASALDGARVAVRFGTGEAIGFSVDG